VNFSIETIPAQPIVGVKTRTTIAQIGDDVGRIMPELMQHASVSMAGPPLARWHSWKGDAGEMEVAVPVNGPVESSGRIEASELPGGRAAVAIHVGSYEGLKATWEDFGKWMEEQGLEGSAAPWEQYMSDCDTTLPEDLQTRIVWPVK